MVKPQLPDLVVTSAVQIQRAVLLEAWIRFSVHIKIRGSREGAFVGIEIYDNTALDEEIDADRCTTPTLQEVVSKSYQNNSHQIALTSTCGYCTRHASVQSHSLGPYSSSSAGKPSLRK